jgi:hypothetical protein
VGFSVDDFYPLKEIVATKVEMQVELAEAIKGQKGRLTQRAIKKRIRKYQPTANQHYLALFFSPEIIRDQMLAKGGKGGDNFHVDPFLLKQIPRPLLAILKKKFIATDTDCSGSINKEEFYVASKKEYGHLTRVQSDTEFERIDVNHDGEMDFNEFCEFMAPRLMVTTLNWEKDDVHNLPETVDQRCRLWIRKTLYSLCCCCFFVEWFVCIAEILRPCVHGTLQQMHSCLLVFGCIGKTKKPEEIHPFDEECETENAPVSTIVQVLAFNKTHNPVTDVPLRTWDREVGKGTALVNSLGRGQIAGPQLTMVR